MDIDTQRIRDLITKRDEIDAELSAIFTGSTPKKTVTCSACNQQGHTARSCPNRAQS